MTPHGAAGAIETANLKASVSEVEVQVDKMHCTIFPVCRAVVDQRATRQNKRASEEMAGYYSGVLQGDRLHSPFLLVDVL